MWGAVTKGSMQVVAAVKVLPFVDVIHINELIVDEIDLVDSRQRGCELRIACLVKREQVLIPLQVPVIQAEVGVAAGDKSTARCLWIHSPDECGGEVWRRLWDRRSR